MKYFIILFLTPFILASCASTYRDMYPRTMNYPAQKTIDEKISYSIKYNPLDESNNQKYAKKESKYNIKVIVVKLTNNTKSPISINDNLVFNNGIRDIKLIDPAFYSSTIKQNTTTYLLYLLLTPLRIETYSYSSTGHTSSSSHNVYRVGLALGPSIALLNWRIASYANKTFRQDLYKYSLNNREIAPGETLYGFLTFQDFGSDPITISVIE